MFRMAFHFRFHLLSTLRQCLRLAVLFPALLDARVAITNSSNRWGLTLPIIVVVSSTTSACSSTFSVTFLMMCLLPFEIISTARLFTCPSNLVVMFSLRLLCCTIVAAVPIFKCLRWLLRLSFTLSSIVLYLIETLLRENGGSIVNDRLPSLRCFIPNHCR